MVIVAARAVQSWTFNKNTDQWECYLWDVVDGEAVKVRPKLATISDEILRDPGTRPFLDQELMRKGLRPLPDKAWPTILPERDERLHPHREDR